MTERHMQQTNGQGTASGQGAGGGPATTGWQDILKPASLKRLLRPLKEVYPRWMRAQQNLPAQTVGDPEAEARAAIRQTLHRIKPGMRIALTAGSRGIAGFNTVLAACIDELKRHGAQPFIIAAMGSHGGATSEGQRELLASYGITEETMGVPIDTRMDARPIGDIDGIPVHFANAALEADGIIAVCRVKPHTSFRSPVESGISKMLVIGLGKHIGAQTLHAAGMENFSRLLPKGAGLIINKAPVLGGIALIENARKGLAHLEWVPAEAIAAREPALLEMAWQMMPQILPKDLDVLIVDEAGKNVSGTGLDPNVTGRFYLPWTEPKPWVRRLVLRSLTPESHGNFNGIVQADIITRRVVEAMDFISTYTNCITSTALEAVKIPFIVETDRDALTVALHTCRCPDPTRARVVRIKNTAALEEIYVSEAVWEAEKGKGTLTPLSDLQPMAFSEGGDLLDIPGTRT